MTYVTFPLSPVPSYWKPAQWHVSGGRRWGAFYPGDTISIKLQAATGGTAYAVRDYLGNVVSSGSLTGTETTITPAVPPGGWELGWYRFYVTGPTNDSLFGNSYSATSFCVVRQNTILPAQPASDASLPSYTGEYSDLPGKAFFGIGTSRLIIANAANPNAAGGDNLPNMQSMAAQAKTWWADTGHPNRPRYLWCAFPNRSFDYLDIGNFVRAYCKDGTVDGDQVFVAAEPGSSSGTKITVRYPDSVTIVETYDNLATRAAAEAAINGASSHIRVYRLASDSPVTAPATAVGHAYFEGVSLVVSTLYPLGVTHFEGPQNEPNISGTNGTEVAHRMRLFQAAVHDGNANAKAIGPCTVDIKTSWADFLNADGGDYCDEISFHAYNSPTQTFLNIGRVDLEAFKARLEQYGEGSKPLWQTESNSQMVPVFGLLMPRRARQALMQTFLYEQYGIPHERNPYWYDLSHGYWPVPCWWGQSDGSVNPQAPMYRVLAEETWGMPYQSALDFGDLGNQIFIGNVYAPPAPNVSNQNLIETFDDGTDGATLPTNLWGNFGNGDGNPTYDSTHVHHGLAGKFLDNQRRWAGTNWNGGTRHHRFYMYREAQGNNAYIQWIGGGGHIRLVGNKIQIQDHVAQGGHTQTGTVDVAIGQWVRIETQLVEGTTTGRVTVRLYNDADSWVPSETIESPATWYVVTGDMELRNGGLGIPIWFDEVVFNAADWVGPAAKSVAIQAASYISDTTITLSTSAPGPLTIVDAFGTESSIPVSGGRIVVPVSDIPTYVRLPYDASVSVYAIRDWPALGVAGQGTNSAVLATAKVGADTIRQIIADGGWMTNYNNSSGIYYDTAELPQIATLMWEKATRIDRVLIFAGNWQNASTPLDFDVQTSVNGTDWVTQVTVDRRAECISFKHGANSNNTGTQRETFWDEQWIYDIPFAAPVTAKALRLLVRHTSYGGNPIDISEALNGVPGQMGQGTNGIERLVLQEIVCLCDDNVRPHYAIGSS